MTKELSFANPPEGHIGLLVYDDQTDKWYAVLGDSDGHIILEVASITLPDGLATSDKQLANDHDVNVSNMISGFATSLKQLANDHDVNVSNMISGFATSLKQLANDHDVNVTNMISGFATSEKQLANDHDVNVSNVDIEVTQADPADLVVGLHGHVGAAWQKQPLIFGYSDRLAESVEHTKVGNGTYVMTVGTVLEGEIWIVNAMLGQNDATLQDQQHQLYNGTDAFTVKVWEDVGIGEWGITDNVYYILKKDDEVRIRFLSCVTGDNLIGRCWGYKMDIDL